MIKPIWKKIKYLYNQRFNSVAYPDVIQLAERGRADAQFAFAKLYESGNSAVKQDLMSAYVLYYLADRQGMLDAKARLRSLELIMPAEQWRKAKDVIRDLEEKGYPRQSAHNTEESRYGDRKGTC